MPKQVDWGRNSEKGGLYPPNPNNESSAYLLDVGYGANLKSVHKVAENGKSLRRDPNGTITTLISGLKRPDGIDISKSTGRMFWTNMGTSVSARDGSVHSAKPDGSDLQIILPEGEVHAPKQLVVDNMNHKVYFCDREGMGVQCCDFNGKNHEILVERGDDSIADKPDQIRWCVGIAVDIKASKFYWWQKGFSKSHKGRIFRANIETPTRENARNRSDIETLLEGLPEPIDLEIDSETVILYWTDRGERPLGNSLNRVKVGADKPVRQEIIAPAFP
jgi:hypothetical protein